MPVLALLRRDPFPAPNRMVRELPTGLAEAEKFLDELVLAASKVE
jgi:hypothetical protein